MPAAGAQPGARRRARRAPARAPAGAPGPAPAPGNRPEPAPPCPRPSAPAALGPAPKAGPASAIIPNAGPRHAGRGAEARPGAARRPRPTVAGSAGTVKAPRRGGGLDLGWALACLGLAGAAALALGRSPVVTKTPSLRVFWRMAYYVTTPIYYVNAEPHLGHAYTTIAADVLARHMRQRGEDVFFLTGTDEHGEPVTQVAEREGITPRELGDRNYVRFKELASALGVTNDFFIRTTDPEHYEVVQRVVQRIYDNGYVYEGTYEGWYCPRCADFKTDSELVEGNKCPIHLVEVERRAGGQLVLSPVYLPGATGAPLRRAAGLRHAADPLQRGALVYRRRGSRTSRSHASA